MHSFYQISWVVIIPVGNWLDENHSRWGSPVWELSGWEFFGWKFSRWEFSWVRVVRVGIFWVGVFRVGIVQWESSRRKFSGWKFSCYRKFVILFHKISIDLILSFPSLTYLTSVEPNPQSPLSTLFAKWNGRALTTSRLQEILSKDIYSKH